MRPRLGRLSQIPLRGLTAGEITYNNFEISLVAFIANITTNHAISYTSTAAPLIRPNCFWPVGRSTVANNEETFFGLIWFGRLMLNSILSERLAREWPTK